MEVVAFIIVVPFLPVFYVIPFVATLFVNKFIKFEYKGSNFVQSVVSSTIQIIFLVGFYFLAEVEIPSPQMDFTRSSYGTLHDLFNSRFCEFGSWKVCWYEYLMMPSFIIIFLVDYVVRSLFKKNIALFPIINSVLLVFTVILFIAYQFANFHINM